MLLSSDQRRDQVVLGIGRAGLQQSLGVGVELGDLPLDLLALLEHAGRVELTLYPVGPVVQTVGVAERCPHHGGDALRRVGLGKGADELAASRLSDRLEQARQKAAHSRAVTLHRSRRKGGIDQATQAAVVIAVDVEHVTDDLLV